MNDTALIIDGERAPEPSRGALADLRSGAMSAPVEVMKLALAEYKERRQTFREWLLAQLIEGVHYGFPPGTEPRYNEERTHVQSQGKWVPLTQWTPKQSFYKAGADFVCDLMGVLDQYEADLGGWQQAGSPPGVFVYACKLVSKANGVTVGEGRGARKCSSDGRIKTDAYNSAVKMAKKSSKVDAVLNAYGLSDLFTQDLEDRAAQPTEHINPEPDDQQPQVAPRAERMTPQDKAAEMKRLVAEWKSRRTDLEGTLDNWAAFVREATGRDFNVKSPSQWSEADLTAVSAAIDKEAGL